MSKWFQLGLVLLLCVGVVSAVEFNLPCSWLRSDTGLPICSSNGLMFSTNNSLFLNGLSSSSFALMSNLSAYYLNSNPRSYINFSQGQVFNDTELIINLSIREVANNLTQASLLNTKVGVGSVACSLGSGLTNITGTVSTITGVCMPVTASNANYSQFVNQSNLLLGSVACSGVNEVLKNISFNGFFSSVCVNVTASGGSGNVTVNGFSASVLDFILPGFIVVQNGDFSLNITNNVSGGSGGGLTLDQAVNMTSNVTFNTVNTTSMLFEQGNRVCTGVNSVCSTGGWVVDGIQTSTSLNMSVQGRLIVTGVSGGVDVNATTLDMSNNYAIRWMNSTGSLVNGLSLDTNNCIIEGDGVTWGSKICKN